jgi:hypothetical protein
MGVVGWLVPAYLWHAAVCLPSVIFFLVAKPACSARCISLGCLLKESVELPLHLLGDASGLLDAFRKVVEALLDGGLGLLGVEPVEQVEGREHDGRCDAPRDGDPAAGAAARRAVARAGRPRHAWAYAAAAAWPSCLHCFASERSRWVVWLWGCGWRCDGGGSGAACVFHCFCSLSLFLRLEINLRSGRETGYVIGCDEKNSLDKNECAVVYIHSLVENVTFWTDSIDPVRDREMSLN